MVKSLWKFYGIYTKEVARFLTVPLQTLITPLLTSFLYLLIFGITMGKMMTTHSGHPYFVFLLPGIILLCLIRSTYENASGSIMIAKYTNEFQDLLTSPLSMHHIILAKSAASITRGFVVALLTLLMGYILFYTSTNSFILFAHPLLFLLMCFLIGFIFSNIGITFSILAKTYDHISGFNMLILTPLTYLGGVFYDINNLPSVWKTLSLYNPIVYMMEGLRFTFFNTSQTSFITSFLITILSCIVSYLLACYSIIKTKNRD